MVVEGVLCLIFHFRRGYGFYFVQSKGLTNFLQTEVDFIVVQDTAGQLEFLKLTLAYGCVSNVRLLSFLRDLVFQNDFLLFQAPEGGKDYISGDHCLLSDFFCRKTALEDLLCSRNQLTRLVLKWVNLDAGHKSLTESLDTEQKLYPLFFRGPKSLT